MNAINIFSKYTPDTLRDALIQAPEDATTATDAAVVLCDLLATLQARVETLERRTAQLEVEMSELRHKAGLTPVDEVYEAARAS